MEKIYNILLETKQNIFNRILEKQDKERYRVVNNIIKNVESRKLRETEETLEDKIDRFITNKPPII